MTRIEIKFGAVFGQDSVDCCNDSRYVWTCWTADAVFGTHVSEIWIVQTFNIAHAL